MKIVILGGGGMLGHQLWRLLQTRFPDTWVTLHRPVSAYEAGDLFLGPNVISDFDVSRSGQMENLFAELKPDVILNCAAITKRRINNQNLPETIWLNSYFPHLLARQCARAGARLIHFSTDCVFSGSEGKYTEETFPTAQDHYGRTKAVGEPLETEALILRTSLIGPELVDGTELLAWFLSQKGKKIKGFKEAIFSGLTTPVMANLVGDIIQKFTSLKGLFQVASAPIDKFSLLSLIKTELNFPIEIEAEESFFCHRDLIGTKFNNATGWQTPTWSQMIHDLALYLQSRKEKPL